MILVAYFLCDGRFGEGTCLVFLEANGKPHTLWFSRTPLKIVLQLWGFEVSRMARAQRSSPEHVRYGMEAPH